ncbi:Uncharacterized membrane protein, DUF485 family [Seinonella peptonophila]|uniref:Uncharacterized membrane protein, DUF485 family n=1 Tax=Seinonella peptonophila TaxID=112248 RepID=A0A1M4Z4A5_9BACL|nr:DUF485 domain-containing protein [Seinonella peptonophila]SHF12913.1 Uncharacterized membrane protein, DUF485 family [Seinonella peptonophila]
MNDPLQSVKQRDVDKLVATEQFQALIKKKKNFIISTSIFFFVFYFSLPIMTSFTDYLNYSISGALTFAWVFAFAQFVMTWVLCSLYTKKAKQFDQLVAEIKSSSVDKEEESA